MRLLTHAEFMHTEFPDPDDDSFSGLDKPDIFVRRPDRWRPARPIVVLPRNLAKAYQVESAHELVGFRFWVVEPDSLGPDDLIPLAKYSNGLVIDLAVLTPHDRETLRQLARELKFPSLDITERQRKERIQ